MGKNKYLNPDTRVLIGLCTQGAGDRSAARDAWLLARILFWTRYAKVEFDGKRWVVHPVEEWCSETGMSLRKVERSLLSLETKGVIERERHLFGGKVRSHVRLSSYAAKALDLP